LVGLNVLSSYPANDLTLPGFGFVGLLPLHDMAVKGIGSSFLCFFISGGGGQLGPSSSTVNGQFPNRKFGFYCIFMNRSQQALQFGMHSFQ
jgi:hypothetical protein